MGDALLQKTYTIDFLTRKRVKNNGIVPQYYVEDNHEAIIPKDIFIAAQEELTRRSNLHSGKRKQKRVHMGKYFLSGKVFCAHCEDIFRRIKWNSRGSKSINWRCITRVEGGPDKCGARTIKEEDLHQVIIKAINEIIDEKDNHIKVLDEMITEVINEKYDETMEDIDDELHKLQKELVNFSNSQEEYESIAESIYEMREKKQDVMIRNATRNEKRRRLSDIKAFLKTSHGLITEYDEDLARRLIEKIIVYDEHLILEFKDGQEIKIKG